MIKIKKIISFIIISLVLRFVYGLGNGFIHAEDHQQLYILGLKFFTTGKWPYFGPDVVYTQSQIPGALQALWIALPLWIIPIPEAPYILLTLAVVGSLSFLSWYLTRLNFSLNSDIIWLWVMTMPWSIFFGSTLLNPSYVMVYAVFFTTAFYEVIRKKDSPPIMSDQMCYFLMGFATLSILQLHLSWVLFLPLIAGAWILGYYQQRNWAMASSRIGFFFLGVSLGGITLFPTLIHYGWNFTGGSEKNIVFYLDNYKNIHKIFFSFLSFPSYNVATAMINYSFDQRPQEIMTDQWWTIPFFVIPYLFGLILVGLYSLSLFGFLFHHANKKDSSKWFMIRLIMVIAILYTWLSFFFNDSGSSPHKYFLFFPLTVIYSLFILEYVWNKKWFRYIYWTSLSLMIMGFIIISFDARYRFSNSYAFHKVRDKIISAIHEKNYTIYGRTRYDYYTNQLDPEEPFRFGY